LRYIAKAEMPEFDADHPLKRGLRIHKEVEQYINGASEDFPSSGKKLQDEIEFCKYMYEDGKASVEEQWGFDEQWQSTGWWDDTVWLRVATDAYATPSTDEAIIYDWKTGKSFGNEVKYTQQGQLYACGSFMRDPSLEHVVVTFGFLDDGKLRTKHYERGAKINKLIAKFTERGNRLTSCVDFRPKPNVMNCKFCPFGPGGTKACIYGAEPL
jgi:hypothetical protein